MDPKCFDKFICAHLPISQVIGSDEEIVQSFAPAKHIVARIFANTARMYRFVFISFFSILDIILIWICVPLLIQGSGSEVLIFFVFSFTLFTLPIGYFIFSLRRINKSNDAFLSSSEYMLTNKKLYLKMTRIGYVKKNRPQVCKLRIIDLSFIRSVNLYKSFWDKRYQETGSIRIKLAPSHRSATLHNLPHPDKVMSSLTKILNSFH
ncbi:MAG: hypothetical protein HWN66_09025 [Candidatus Helarchaeota archaeon]|nr:hypothetical protein [Candidatus Helarchaeota archaeon]